MKRAKGATLAEIVETGDGRGTGTALILSGHKKGTKPADLPS
jgi:hypothetical protein